MPSHRRLRERLVGPAMVIGGLLLVPWIMYLAGALPHTTRARNWSLMWTGLDVVEAVGLVLTGILLWRRSPHRALPAAFTSALLAADAWIDVTTSAPGHAKVLAILMAGLLEVPAAIGCLVLSIRAFPRAPADSSQPAAGSARAVVNASHVTVGRSSPPVGASTRDLPERATSPRH